MQIFILVALASASLAIAAATTTTTSTTSATTTTSTSTTTGTASPPVFTGTGNITCESFAYQIANPIFYSNKYYLNYTYLGVQTNGAPQALTLKYGYQGSADQPPTPLSFYKCRSEYMPKEINNVTVTRFFGHLRLANTQNREVCFYVKSLKNARVDQKIYTGACKYQDGKAQLKQWWQLDQYDDNMQISFVGRPDTPYDDGSFGSYKSVNLTEPILYDEGDNASFWGLHWSKAAEQKPTYTIQLEYNSS
ncbi:hypothetical protein V8E36_003184 [Tilletia maclaganii]